MNSINSQPTFSKNKYGSELLVNVVDMKNVKRFLSRNSARALTFYYITFITEGEGLFTVDDQNYNAVPQDVLFSRPGDDRIWKPRHVVQGCSLIFDDHLLSSFLKDSFFVQRLPYFNYDLFKLHLSDKLYTRMLQLLKEIKEEADSYRQNDVHVLRALLYEALSLLNRACYDDAPFEDPKMRSARSFVNQFVELVDTSMKGQHAAKFYASRLCLKPSYLNEIVNLIKGVSAEQYILNKLMEEAKNLILCTDFSISEIALELGFSSDVPFIRYFRQHTGRTPIVFRELYTPQ